jgi:hypothetical protein
MPRPSSPPTPPPDFGWVNVSHQLAQPALPAQPANVTSQPAAAKPVAPEDVEPSEENMFYAALLTFTTMMIMFLLFSVLVPWKAKYLTKATAGP